jgi:hypothetical protein
MLPDLNIRKYSWTTPDRKMAFNYARCRSFSGADCDAKVKQCLLVRKRTAQKSDVETINLKKLSEIEVRKEYQIKISKRFETFEYLNDSEDINRLGKRTENIKISVKETLGFLWEQHKTWLDEKRSQFSDQKEAG